MSIAQPQTCDRGFHLDIINAQKVAESLFAKYIRIALATFREFDDFKSEHGISWTHGKVNHFLGLQAASAGTIRVYHQQRNVRLVGFDAPETRHAECQAEFELGSRATRRLRDIIKLGNLDFTYVRCSCPEATQGTFACNYGRDCGTLKSNGRDVGLIVIEEGLAVPFTCGADHCPKTPRPWCQ